jgi:hypothetical protein
VNVLLLKVAAALIGDENLWEPQTDPEAEPALRKKPVKLRSYIGIERRTDQYNGGVRRLQNFKAEKPAGECTQIFDQNMMGELKKEITKLIAKNTALQTELSALMEADRFEKLQEDLGVDEDEQPVDPIPGRKRTRTASVAQKRAPRSGPSGTATAGAPPPKKKAKQSAAQPSISTSQAVDRDALAALAAAAAEGDLE